MFLHTWRGHAYRVAKASFREGRRPRVHNGARPYVHAYERCRTGTRGTGPCTSGALNECKSMVCLCLYVSYVPGSGVRDRSVRYFGWYRAPYSTINDTHNVGTVQPYVSVPVAGTADGRHYLEHLEHLECGWALTGALGALGVQIAASVQCTSASLGALGESMGESWLLARRSSTIR